MNHLQACVYCPKWTKEGCTVYPERYLFDRVQLHGCPVYPYRDIPRSRGEYVDGVIVSGSQRPGQQKQKNQDRKYHSKNDGKRKYTLKEMQKA